MKTRSRQKYAWNDKDDSERIESASVEWWLEFLEDPANKAPELDFDTYSKYGLVETTRLLQENRTLDASIVKVRTRGIGTFTTETVLREAPLEIPTDAPHRMIASLLDKEQLTYKLLEGQSGMGKTSPASLMESSIREFENYLPDAPYFQQSRHDHRMEYIAKSLKHYYDNLLNYNPPYINKWARSLMEKEVAGNWAFNELDSVLKQSDEYMGVPVGISTSYCYANCMYSAFPYHREDEVTNSANYMYTSCPGGFKFWAVIEMFSVPAFEELMTRLFREIGDNEDCQDKICHKVCAIHPKTLIDNGIKVKFLIQEPLDLVITACYGYHSGISFGVGLSEAINYATRDWINTALYSKFDICGGLEQNFGDVYSCNLWFFVKLYLPAEQYKEYIEGRMVLDDPRYTSDAGRPARMSIFGSLDGCIKMFYKLFSMKKLDNNSKIIMQKTMHELCCFSCDTTYNHERLSELLTDMLEAGQRGSFSTEDEKYFCIMVTNMVVLSPSLLEEDLFERIVFRFISLVTFLRDDDDGNSLKYLVSKLLLLSADMVVVPEHDMLKTYGKKFLMQVPSTQRLQIHPYFRPFPEQMFNGATSSNPTENLISIWDINQVLHQPGDFCCMKSRLMEYFKQNNEILDRLLKHGCNVAKHNPDMSKILAEIHSTLGWTSNDKQMTMKRAMEAAAKKQIHATIHQSSSSSSSGHSSLPASTSSDTDRSNSRRSKRPSKRVETSTSEHELSDGGKQSRKKPRKELVRLEDVRFSSRDKPICYGPCAEEFGSMYSLERHIEKFGDRCRPKRFKCQICGRGYGGLPQLSAHQRKVHPVNTTEPAGENEHECNYEVNSDEETA